MTALLLAQAGAGGLRGLGELAIIIIIILAIAAAVWVVVTKGFGWQIPQWLSILFMIGLAAFCGVVLVRFLLTL